MTSHHVPHGHARTGWLGWVMFAGVVLLVTGIVEVLYGLFALSRSGNAYVTPAGASLTLDFSQVGWSALVLGIVLAATGAGVMAGWTWARVVAILLVALSLLANLVLFTAEPVWSAVVIVLDVIVIYALAAHGKEAGRAGRGR